MYLSTSLIVDQYSFASGIARISAALSCFCVDKFTFDIAWTSFDNYPVISHMESVRYLSEEIYERAELSGEESEDREVATCLRLFSQASLMPSHDPWQNLS